jgi:hypothetical protein
VPLALGDLQVRQRRFIPKTEHLPRQARDKHLESTQKKGPYLPRTIEISAAEALGDPAPAPLTPDDKYNLM